MSSAVVNGLAGAGGGIIAQIITYPLQTVNTRQQTERVAKKGLVNSGGSLPPPKRPAGGTLVQILQVLRTEGWGGLYSGLKPSLLGTAASQGIYYYFYQVFKNKAEAIASTRRNKGRGDGTVGMFSWLAVAAIAGSLNVLLTNPIWVLVTRMQTHTQAERKIMEGKREALLREASESSVTSSSTLQNKLAELDSIKPHPYGTLHAVYDHGPYIPNYHMGGSKVRNFDAVLGTVGLGAVCYGVINDSIPTMFTDGDMVNIAVAREVYNEAGITGFWKGIIPTLIMVCNPSIQFMIYESSLKHLRAKRAANKQGLKVVTALEVFLLGALAKLGATVSTYPLLVVKSRLQAKQEIGGNISLRYSGTLDAIIKMIRYEGLLGFYKGMSTKIVQSVFAASVLFLVKEELVKGYMVLADKSQKVILNVVK